MNEPHTDPKAAREIWYAAQERWLAQPGGSYAGLCGILIGVVAGGNPELLVKAAELADEYVSIDHIVAEGIGVTQ